MAINYSYPSGTIAGDDLVLIMDSAKTGKPTRTVTAQSIANLYNAGGVAGVASFKTTLSGLTPTVASTNAISLDGTLGVASGGTGSTTFAQGGILYGDTTSPVAATAVGTAGQVLTSNGAGAAPTFQAAAGSGITTLNAQTGATQTFTNMANGVTITSAGNAHALGLAGQIPVANGGTGIGAYTAGDLLYASGATTLSKLAAGAAGEYLQGGTTPAWTALKNQAAITQYSIAVGDAAGEIASSSYILIGDGAANRVNIGNSTAASEVIIGNTTAGTTTTVSGVANFNVTHNLAADNNLSFGANAFGSLVPTSAQNNTAIGIGSMTTVNTGDRNVAVGKDALATLSTGDDNIGIGNTTGGTLATGSANVIIGNLANVRSAANAYGVVVGEQATSGSNAVSIGAGTNSNNGGIAIGHLATAGANAISIGSATTPLTLSSGQNTGAATLPITINGVQYYIRIYT